MSRLLPHNTKRTTTTTRIWVLFVAVAILLISLVLQAFNCYPWETLKSYCVMYLYNIKEHRESALYRRSIEFYVPSGMETKEKDWYPIMLTFNGDQSFLEYVGEAVELTILYSFGHFDFLKGSSQIFNPSSPYYSSFYGGYAIFYKDDPGRGWGIDSDGNIDIDKLSIVPKFDMEQLVLPSVGCPRDRYQFDSHIIDVQYDVPYIGYQGWVRIDAMIDTTGLSHLYEGQKHMGYIQYGKPHPDYYTGVDYPATRLYGRTYARYFEELGGTFMLYCMTTDKSTLEKVDANLLSKSTINRK